MELLWKLKEELDRLKEELKGMACAKVLVQTLEGYNERLTRVEERMKGLEVALGIVTEPKVEGAQS
jgi:hypothetical protein